MNVRAEPINNVNDFMSEENNNPKVTTRASVTQGHKPIVPPNGSQKVKINNIKRGKK